MFLNLFINALKKAMPGSGWLAVRVQPDNPGTIRVEVEDSGIGIHSQDLKRLFEAFYTTKSGGMGIGLSVSRSIVEKHRGRLWAEANNGPGATFSFSIPCVTDVGAITAPQ